MDINSMYEGFRVDWLELTQKWRSHDEKHANTFTARLKQRLDEGLGQGVMVKGRNGYTHAMAWHDGSIRLDWHYDDVVASNMGWHWTFTGKSNDVVPGGLLLMVIHAARDRDVADISCSRVDLAFDSWVWVDLRQVKEQLQDDMKSGLVRRRHVHAHDVNNVIESVNINRMSSDVYARWYDKGLETKTLLQGVWTRLEFKVMRKHSRALFLGLTPIAQTKRIREGEMACTQFLAEAYIGYLKSYFGERALKDLGVGQWGLVPRFYGSGGKMADSDHWLMTTVASGIRKRLNTFDDRDHAIAWLEYWFGEVKQGLKHDITIKAK